MTGSRGTWFIAGINGTAQAHEVKLDLKSLGTLVKTTLIYEGGDAKNQFTVEASKSSDGWTHQMPPRGGFVLRLDN